MSPDKNIIKTHLCGSIQNGKLSIEDISPKDEGVYVCEAQNTVGTIAVSATLSVHGEFN